MELNSGTYLQNGKYRIERTLGQGSFGITYLAKTKFSTTGTLGQMEVEATVAIKEFFMSEVNRRCTDGSTVEGSGGTICVNYRKKFRKEAENLSRLSHPNIVRVFDVFDENNTSYYAMEYVDGCNLDEYIGQKGCLAEGEALRIAKEIGGALDYMHSHRMLHLDLKPKNVMRRTDDGHYYLIDFGLSKLFADNGEPESSTTIGGGTPGYAPLEQSQYRQEGSFPATLDIYALGATLFKMLTGKRPPEASVLLNECFPKVELEARGVSTQTISVVEKAMSPIWKQRYATVVECLNAFDDEATTIADVDTDGYKQNIKNADKKRHETHEAHSVDSQKARLNIVDIWKSRSLITNVMLIIGYFIVFQSLLSSISSFVDVVYLVISVVYLNGLVMISYGQRRLLFFTFLPFVCASFYMLLESGLDKLNLLSTIGYVIALLGLLFKKSGKTAYALLESRTMTPFETVCRTFTSWHIVTRILYITLLLVVMIAILALFSNRHIEYYRYGFVELVCVLYAVALISQNLKIGMFLVPLFLVLCVKAIHGLDVAKEGYGDDWMVEKFIAIGYFLEWIALTVFKKNGKTAWKRMR